MLKRIHTWKFVEVVSIVLITLANLNIFPQMTFFLLCLPDNTRTKTMKQAVVFTFLQACFFSLPWVRVNIAPCSSKQLVSTTSSQGTRVDMTVFDFFFCDLLFELGWQYSFHL